MNSDVTIIQSRFHYTEKAYVPNTSNIVVIIDELIKLMEPYFRKQAPTFRLINDLRFDHPETALLTTKFISAVWTLPGLK